MAAPKVQVQPDLIEAVTKLEAYVVPKQSKVGKDILNKISALADKTAKEKANLVQHKKTRREVSEAYANRA